MTKNQKGFTLIESVLMVLIFLAIGGVGYYVYQSHHKSTQADQSEGKWLTYKSTHSSVQFQYPSSWKLQDESKPRDQESLAVSPLEQIMLHGPNNMALNYLLNDSKPSDGKPHIRALCDVYFEESDVQSVGNLLNIMVERGGTDFKNGSSILLRSKADFPPAGYGGEDNGCGPKRSIYLPGAKYANLSASYEAQPCGGQGSCLSIKETTENQKLVSDYLKLPEVKTAIEIFKTLKY